MQDEPDHSRCVTAWMARARAAPESILAAFEQAFDALWQRIRLTLGDVTLSAIVGRVLYTAAERFPMLSALTVEPNGLGCQALAKQAETIPIPRDQLEEAVAYVLKDFLTVLGTLTAEVLTPALHAEMAKLPRALPATGPRSGEGGCGDTASTGSGTGES